jgi:hypothetical protein
MQMDESEFGSMDSFVDIVANTVGVVIILTMLTIMGADQSGMVVNLDRKKFVELRDINRDSLDQIEERTKQVRLARARHGMSETKAKAKIGLESLKEARALLNAAEARRARTSTRKRSLSSQLSDLRAEEAGHKSAIELAKKEATELAAEMPGFDIGELDRSSLADMNQSVEGLEAEVQTLTEDKAASQSKHEELKKQAVELETRTKDLERELASLRGESEITIDVKAPRARRDYKRLPVLVECYARPAQPGDTFLQQYVRFFDAYEKDKDGVLKAPAGGSDGGESVLDIEKEDSQFRTFLAGSGEYTKETTCLRFIVRPDAYRVFHRARQIARGAGWEVDWQPIEPGEPPAAGSVGARRTDGPPRS